MLQILGRIPYCGDYRTIHLVEEYIRWSRRDEGASPWIAGRRPSSRPLHGIPIDSRNIYDTAGVAIEGDSKLCLQRVAAADATTTRL